MGRSGGPEVRAATLVWFRDGSSEQKYQRQSWRQQRLEAERRFMEVVKEERGEEAGGGVRRQQMVWCSDPWRAELEGKEDHLNR